MSQKTEVRIVAGSLRGRKLVCTVHEGMRPTPQMVREALFSILGNAVPGRIFYDIFAGTGVNGFEAVSRGASRAVLIEKDPKQANECQKYAERFGVGGQVSVIRGDAYRWVERWVPPPGGAVNLFLSPPFPDLQPGKLRDFMPLIRALLDKAPDDSVVALQAEDGFPAEDLPDGEGAWDIRRYGRNSLYFRVKGEPIPAEADAVEAAPAAESP